MNIDNLNNALYERMREEQGFYHAWLVKQPAEEILNHAYEYTIRQNILTEMETLELSENQVKVLIASPYPLSDIFKDFRNMETRHMEDIRSCIEIHADQLIQAQEKLYSVPVYKYPCDYARDNGELDQYRLSRRANFACVAAIENAIQAHHDINSFDAKAALRDVVKKFGYDRTLFVLAATIRERNGDGRFSPSNKNWARTVADFDEIASDFVVSSHPTLTNAFVSEARREHLLSLSLSKQDIKEEALSILSKFQDAQEPNSPNGTHYMAQVSPDFLARAGTKDTDRLMAMLPFQTLSLSGLEGRKGTYALISKDEDRFQKLVLRKPSVRKKLQEQPADSSPSTKKNPRTRSGKGGFIMGKCYRKPRVYLEQYYNGWFMLKRTKSWVAKDSFGNYVTSARTRKECEEQCRRMGYCPERVAISPRKSSVLKKLQETPTPRKVSGPSRGKEQER